MKQKITSELSVCSYFKNMYARSTTNLNVSEVLDSIKNGKIFGNDFSKQIEAIRLEPDKEKRRRLKKELPAVTFGGIYENFHRNPLISSSDHICLDYDNVTDLTNTKKIVGELPFTRACFVSPSGDGLKILVQTSCTDDSNYKEGINQLFQYYKENAGISSDKSKVNINDFCYLSHDADVVINNKSDLWVIEDVKEKPKAKTISENIKIDPNVEAVINTLIEKKIDITLEYEDWRNLAYAFATAYGEVGRELFKLVSQFNKNYKELEADKQFTACLKSNSKKITIGTFFFIAKKYGIELTKGDNSSEESSTHFWYHTDGGYKIDIAELYQYLFKAGFRRFEFGVNSKVLLVRIEKKIVTPVEKSELVKWFFDFIEALDLSEMRKKGLKNTYYRNQNLFSDNNLQTLIEFGEKMKRDERDRAWLYFKNCICEISDSNIKIYNYDDLDSFIWKRQIIDHEFVFNRDKDAVVSEAEISQFLLDICQHEDEEKTKKRFQAIRSIIAYLVHDHKDPANTKCIVLMDANDSDEPNGGTGKGIIAKIISSIVPMAREDGKTFSTKSEFGYSQVNPETKVLFIDDITESFNFEKFFSVITEGIVVNKKYENKKHIRFEESPKLLLSTNYTLAGEGESHSRRKVEFELSNYYNINRTPQEKFGHLLFKDWDTEQWNKFYSFIVYSLQFYFQHGLITPPSVNLDMRRLRSLAGEEFIEFVSKNVKTDKSYNKNDLYVKFMEANKYYHKINSQKTFTKCLRAYARAYSLNILESKSGEKYSFLFAKKG